jgi:cell shape-determining protein MreC
MSEELNRLQEKVRELEEENRKLKKVIGKSYEETTVHRYIKTEGSPLSLPPWLL